MPIEEAINFYLNRLQSFLIEINKLEQSNDVIDFKNLLLVNIVFLDELLELNNSTIKKDLFFNIKNDISSIIDDFDSILIELKNNISN